MINQSHINPEDLKKMTSSIEGSEDFEHANLNPKTGNLDTRLSAGFGAKTAAQSGDTPKLDELYFHGSRQE